MSYRRQITIWIGASCVLLALTGTLQFLWIGNVADSQERLERNSLNGSMNLVTTDLRSKLRLLLTTFKATVDLDQERRLEQYLQCYYSWHELSMHGPVVKRILFYDLSARGVGDLTELDGDSKSIQRVNWDEDLVSVRRHIRKFGFPPGRGVKARWPATWTFHPQAMAISRPMVTDGPSQRRRTDWLAVTGYLILQLDLDFVRDRLIPNVLQDHFSSSSAGNAQYVVTLTLDDEHLLTYEPLGQTAAHPTDTGTVAFAYSPSSLQERAGADRTRPPDYSKHLLARTNVPEAVKQRGGVDQVVLWTNAGLSRLQELGVASSDSLLTADLDDEDRPSLPVDVLRRSSGMPRLVVAAEERHTMYLEARHVGSSLSDLLNRRYIRSLATGMVVLLLLLVATAMIAMTGGRAAQRAEDRMAAVASQSHELRTPLAVILVLADNMVKGMLGHSEKVLQYGELIRDYGKRLRKMVDRATQASAIDSLERRYNLTTLDVSKVARDAFEEVRPLIDDAGFAAEISLAEGLPLVRADPEALRQCVGDLLSNAVKYGLPGRWVRIETCEAPAGPGREVQIRVHDQGRGIPAREARKIFESYYRVADDSTPPVPGSGLGLTLVRKMVKRMEGEVTLESNEGQGSVFTIHLPVAA